MQKKVEGPGEKSPSCESDLWLNDQNGEGCMSQHPFRSAAREKSLDARPAEAPHNNYIRLIFFAVSVMTLYTLQFNYNIYTEVKLLLRD